MSDDERVRVLDAGAPTAPPTSPSTTWLWWVLGFAAVMVIGLWGTGRSSDQTDEGAAMELARAVPSLASAAPIVPKLVGLSADEAIAVLRDARVITGAPGSFATRWIASEAAERGEVIAQDPLAGVVLDGGRSLVLRISAGGPVVGLRELPPLVREFALGLPGFDPAEPILELPTPAGSVYKTDDWLFGRCDAVRIAGPDAHPDPSYGEDCVAVSTVALSGVLPDGTRYTIGGLPEGRYRPTGISGGLVLERNGGALPLGPTTYTLVDGPVEPQVSWDEGELVVTAGRWSMRTAVNRSVVDDLGDQAAEVLVAAATARADGDYIVVRGEPPLRLQRAGELPSRLGVEYGTFRVVADCVSGVDNVVCDESGELSVEPVASSFDVSQVEVHIDSGPGTAGAEGES